jgi:hypothetical protein
MSVAVWTSPTLPVGGTLTIADAVEQADAGIADLGQRRVGRSEQAGLLACLAGVLLAAFIQIVAQPLLPTGPFNPPVTSGYAAR